MECYCPKSLEALFVFNFLVLLLMAQPIKPLGLTVEFSGGAELLFGEKKIQLELPVQGEDKWTIKRLLQWLVNNRLKERLELFMQDETVRPGILVLINDTDWELLGELNYELQEKDNILFISTLHGG